MAESRSPDILADADEDRLDAFEAAWRTDSVPQIEDYLSGKTDPALVFAVLSIDLEYRWKQFSASSEQSDRDRLPACPKLEDYADLLPDISHAILTLRLMAEEYRVRTRWGDQPSRDEYHSRFRQKATEVDSWLDQIEREIHLESDVTERSGQSSQSDSLGTTVSHLDHDHTSSSLTISLSDCPMIGKYQTKRLLGRGGFGEVWLADHPQLGCEVAVKIPRRDRLYPPEVLSAFLDEGKKLSALRTLQGVVKVRDADELNGIPYIVSDYIDGESFDERLKRERLRHDESVQLVAKIARILHGAHLKGLVHRDVKPANILLNSQAEPHLADFGLAATEMEMTGEAPSVVGTYAFMSPEQARGDSNLVDGRTDIYSLGVVLYLALTGRLPFIGQNDRQYIERIIKAEPRPPRAIDESIPEQLERICLRCLSKNIDERFTTAQDLERALRAFLDESTTRPNSARRRFLQATLGCAAIAGVGWGVFHFLKKSSTVPARDPTDLAIQELPLGDESSKWNLSTDRRSLTISSLGLSMLSFGSFSKTFSLSLEFTQPLWPGRLAIFFGHRVVQSNGLARYDSLQISRMTDGSHIAYGKEWTYWPTDPANQSNPDIWAKHPLKVLSRPHLPVAVELKDGLIETARIGDELLHSFQGKAIADGLVGIWCASTSFEVSNLVVNGRERTFYRAGESQ